jgi:xanthine phosphoribosyltransferase
MRMVVCLQVPVVYARKERNIVMADTFKAGYSSKTVGKNRELLVSKSHLDEDDRVLIVDDFVIQRDIARSLALHCVGCGCHGGGCGRKIIKDRWWTFAF